MSSRIEDYAIIGDCHTAALVGRDGSIDWLCLPRFDSAACFAALLGTRDNGRWLIAPEGEVRNVRRRYRGGTLILETDFETASGAVRLIDFMPLRTENPYLVRIAEGLRGEVPMRMELTIRFDYGSVVPWVRKLGPGIRATAGPDTLVIQSQAELSGENYHTKAKFTVHEGERVSSEMLWTSTYRDDPAEFDPERRLRETEDWWREWSGRCEYEGRWKEAVVRSLITLKALTYAPTGGVVAAPTTSLPEKLGGPRNWDYRFCWLRDATFTLYSLMVGGYVEEARAWREWLIDAVAGMPSQMRIMYGLAGERRILESEIDWLPGYEGSKPVRVGNAAFTQHQLDVYGEVMDALYLTLRSGLAPDENAWRVARELVDFLETDWRRPDHGIWEIRGPRRHFTHSKVMAWVAMDRAVKAIEQFGAPGDLEKWKRLRGEIRQEVLDQGFDPALNSFVQYYGSKDPDASLLVLPQVGFLPADDPRMTGTVRYIEKRLLNNGFIQRYPTESGVDGLPPGEAAFLVCTFWYADNLLLEGREKEGCEVFERLLDIRNDVGLLAEEYDVHQRRLLGNFPQAFSHVGLVNTARNLDRGGGPAEQRHGGGL